MKMRKTSHIIKIHNRMEDLAPREKEFVLHTKPQYMARAIRRIEKLKKHISKKKIQCYERRIHNFYKKERKALSDAYIKLARLIFSSIRRIKYAEADMPFITVACISYFPGLDYFIAIDIRFLEKYKILNKVIRIKYNALRKKYFIGRAKARYMLNNLDAEHFIKLKSYMADVGNKDIVFMGPPPDRSILMKENLSILKGRISSGFEYLKYKDFSDYKAKQLGELEKHWHNSLPFLWFELLSMEGIKSELEESLERKDKKYIKLYKEVIKKLKKQPYFYTKETIFTNKISLKILKAVIMEIFRKHGIKEIDKRVLSLNLHITFDRI